MSCSAVCCSSRTTKGGVKVPELSFHTFPKCPELRNEWVKALRRSNWQPSKYSRLCSKHFEDSCYVSGLSIKKLKADAVPTIFEGYPSYYQSTAKKRKSPQRRLDIDCIISPRQLKKVQETGVKMEDIPTSPRRALKLLMKSRTVAKKRLGTIKKLRERNRRLERKNAMLLNVITDLTSKNLDTDGSNFSVSCVYGPE